MALHPDATRPYDTAVIAPDAIRAGASRADELIAAEQAKARGEAPPTPVQPQPEGKDALPPAAPPVQQDPQSVPVAPEAPPAPPPEEWERRYRSMKGRHDALAANTMELQRQVEELRRAQQAPPPEPPANFDEEDTSTWGPDMVNMVKRRVDAAVAQVRAEMSGRVQQVEQVAQAGTEGALRAELDRLMPDWQDVNNDPQFHAWLALPDEMSGVKRHALVNKAYDERNAQRVLKFFSSFLSEAAPAPAGGQHAAPLPAPNGGQPPASQRLSLADLAAPGAARPAAAANPPAAPTVKRFWTQPEIAQFFAAKHRGLYNRTPEDRALCAAYEADIFAAQTENRVR